MNILLFLLESEVRSVLSLISSIVILILSANSVILPTFIWAWVSWNFLTEAFYFIIALLIARWLARGKQYSDIVTMNLEGQAFVITGAAGGIGKETAIELAKHGARVILLARSTNLYQTLNDVKMVARKPDNVTGYAIDLADLQSINQCVEKLLKNENKNVKITALINNAGIMACPYSKTKDGFELQMGTNHFGHFYLTKLLLPRLYSARIVNVSSLAHFMWRVPCDINYYTKICNPNAYHPWSAYSLSKTANILHARELYNRYSKSHHIRAYSLHPGTVNTEIDRYSNPYGFVRKMTYPIRRIFLKTPIEGIQTTLYCALSNEAKPGEYHSNCQPTSVYHKYAKDDKLACEWWNYSEYIIDEKLKTIS